MKKFNWVNDTKPGTVRHLLKNEAGAVIAFIWKCRDSKVTKDSWKVHTFNENTKSNAMVAWVEPDGFRAADITLAKRTAEAFATGAAPPKNSAIRLYEKTT